MIKTNEFMDNLIYVRVRVILYIYIKNISNFINEIHVIPETTFHME